MLSTVNLFLPQSNSHSYYSSYEDFYKTTVSIIATASMLDTTIIIRYVEATNDQCAHIRVLVL